MVVEAAAKVNHACVSCRFCHRAALSRCTQPVRLVLCPCASGLRLSIGGHLFKTQGDIVKEKLTKEVIEGIISDAFVETEQRLRTVSVVCLSKSRCPSLNLLAKIAQLPKL